MASLRDPQRRARLDGLAASKGVTLDVQPKVVDYTGNNVVDAFAARLGQGK